MQANQMTPTPIVIRVRFFSATEEPDATEDMPPPNMLDRPPPLPLCSSTMRIRTALETSSRIIRV
jgi:hypothetical protein